MSALDSILAPVVHFIHTTISTMGPLGVSMLMAIESCNVPLPSEAILPFAGYLVSKGNMTIHTAAFAGALGCVLGSIPSYYLGYFGGRPFVEKYGKWFLISHRDLEMADKWEQKYGNLAFFICRMLPIVRTFISLPAGILKADIKMFTLFTFLGSLIWSYPLVYVGIKLGEHTEALKAFWHKFDLAIVLVLGTLFVLYLINHFKHLKES
ncbi:MAG TPA: DedA family protein [Candidatus Gastranaerophilaceae bacterium]|nr:DedA family protein [Candidatus Gastranaerophilaceae bacterium]HPT40985.1 DedA family protein [Candidatus Gastranaerophilaceae bacterium]